MAEPMGDERLAQLRMKAEDALPILSAPGSFPRDVLELITEIDRLRAEVARQESLLQTSFRVGGRWAERLEARAEKAEAALARVTDDSARRWIAHYLSDVREGARAADEIHGHIRAVAAGEEADDA